MSVASGGCDAGSAGYGLGMTRTEIGQVLHRWREAAGLSRAAVARGLSARRSGELVRRWEAGLTLPYAGDVRELGGLCRAPISEVRRTAEHVARLRSERPSKERSDGERMEKAVG